MVGFALRPAVDSPNVLHTASMALLVVTEAALVLYWATIGRVLARIRPAILWTAIASGLAAVVLQGLESLGEPSG